MQQGKQNKIYKKEKTCIINNIIQTKAPRNLKFNNNNNSNSRFSISNK